MWVIAIFCLLLLGCGSEESTYIGQLQSGTEKQRAQAASFLGAQRVAKAIPDLRGALQDESNLVCAKVIWALGMLRSKDAFHDLVPFLKHSDRDIRQATARALMQIEEPEAIGPLTEALESEADEWVKMDMQAALVHLRQFEGETDIGEATVRGEFF